MFFAGKNPQMKRKGTTCPHSIERVLSTFTNYLDESNSHTKNYNFKTSEISSKLRFGFASLQTKPAQIIIKWLTKPSHFTSPGILIASNQNPTKRRQASIQLWKSSKYSDKLLLMQLEIHHKYPKLNWSTMPINPSTKSQTR